LFVAARENRDDMAELLLRYGPKPALRSRWHCIADGETLAGGRGSPEALRCSGLKRVPSSRACGTPLVEEIEDLLVVLDP
jgi:hypothetical protein